MRQFLSYLTTVALLFAGTPTYASKIQQQGIKSAADCTAAGAALGSCLPLDSQIYMTSTTPNMQLSSAVAAGLIGGGGVAGKNYLSNASFEAFSSGFTGWTLSGATPTANTTDYHDGAQSASLALTAGGSISQDVTTSTNLQGTNLEAGAWVKTTVSGVTVCARVSGVNVSCNSVPTSGTWQYVNANFVGPASGTSIGVAVVWTGSSGTVLVDQGYVGQATNLSQVSQAQLIGTVTVTGCTSYWNASNASFADYSVQTSCTYTTTGSLQAPATMLPGFIIPSIGPGYIEIQYNGLAYAGTSVNSLRYYDGTTGTSPIYLQANSPSTSVLGGYTYTTPQTNLFIRIQEQGNGAGNLGQIYGQSGIPGTFKVYYFPTQAQIAVSSSKAIDSVGTIITTASTTCPIGSFSADGTAVSRTTYARLFNKIGITHGQGDGSTTFNIPDYRGRFLRVVDGAAGRDPDSASRTAMATGGTTGNAVGSVQLDDYKSHTHGFTSVSAGSAPLFGGYINGTQTSAQATTASGGNETRPTNAYVNACIIFDGSLSAPVLVGSVTSSSAGADKIVKGKFYTTSFGTSCAASPCAIAADPAVSSVTRASSGDYTINFASGTFSAPPSCFFINGDNNASIPRDEYQSTNTTTAYRIVFRGATIWPTLLDTSSSFLCVGPR